MDDDTYTETVGLALHLERRRQRQLTEAILTALGMLFGGAE